VIVQIEDVMKSFEILRQEGKFDYIGMSECRAETIRRAAKVRDQKVLLLHHYSYPVVSQVARVSAVEIEISPLSYEAETKEGE
jgi:pyridoxine 4-dehydrogenase